ncbi:hypothetical protein C1S82_12195 [Mycolicibacterium cosmeticum]|uniref:Uncharacterized protein n=2 Tax=Mycolicibacterium cosmeticum TaxID=258533 RepID=W9AZW2_MYCCO|nr:hypothetical protein [Mycolicibacterium cosmeticum]TLH74266.1 hypothetical protein C1S82_12195 [Mycolicibacterium cosmeticum]CDO11053.1 hypothetical protein BN977_05894 [Mycolicibacterium cosmeticum]
MQMKTFAAGIATAGLLGLGGLGVGLAQADPHTPPPSPTSPGNSDNSGGADRTQAPRPTTVTGPGVNAGEPGTPLPPGQGYLPPPGHGGPLPQDRISFPAAPAWVTTPVTPPTDAPAQPELPDWATGMTIVWNPDLGTWGVWDDEMNTFVRL